MPVSTFKVTPLITTETNSSSFYVCPCLKTTNRLFSTDYLKKHKEKGGATYLSTYMHGKWSVYLDYIRKNDL